MLVCPICKARLERQERAFICESRHNFDIAREGYVNLLVRRQPQRRRPGDSPEMLQARRRTLTRGFYDELLDALLPRVERGVRGVTTPEILDAGCGDGSVLWRCGQRSAHSPARIGVDIAQAGVRIAARQDPTGIYAVASVFDLPLATAGTSVVLSILSPIAWSEFARVLQPRGLVMVVQPGPWHLHEVRDQL